ncbi:MAG TPA: DUF4369 domain-containing protein, partial [Chitinophagaceae bacterium]|nr:DUF4369 domain-containing protein [Chitinophagaceae bacterium]
MKRPLFLAALVALSFSSYTQSTGYTIPIVLTPYKNQYIYLGYYYGKVKALADSVKLDNNSTGVFKGSKALPGGIYFIVSPKKEIAFELLLDKQQHFSIRADSAGGPDKVVFTGSADNTVFQTYSRSVNKTGAEITALHKQLPDAKMKADSTKISDQIQALNKK